MDYEDCLLLRLHLALPDLQGWERRGGEEEGVRRGKVITGSALIFCGYK